MLGGGAHVDGGVWLDGDRTSGSIRRWRARTVSMSSQGPWSKDEVGLVQRVECLGQRKAERRSPLEPTEATALQSDRACP